MANGGSNMSKKLKLFSAAQKEAPTKRQLIAASEFAKDPQTIMRLSEKLAFVREDKGFKNAKR